MLLAFGSRKDDFRFPDSEEGVKVEEEEEKGEEEEEEEDGRDRSYFFTWQNATEISCYFVLFISPFRQSMRRKIALKSRYFVRMALLF